MLGKNDLEIFVSELIMGQSPWPYKVCSIDDPKVDVHIVKPYIKVNSVSGEGFRY